MSLVNRPQSGRSYPVLVLSLRFSLDSVDADLTVVSTF